MKKINQEEYENEETEVKKKQELIEEWESAIEAAEFYGKGKEERLISYMKDFVSDLNQLEEPESSSQELPSIPQFVADAIEVTKMAQLNYYDMLKALEKESVQDRTRSWVFNGNLGTFAKAWLYGYEVEEEQKYRVIDSHKVYLLAKEEEERNKVETVAELVEFYGHEHVELNYQLTEQEIKDYDERYWPFAVKVEEMEK